MPETSTTEFASESPFTPDSHFAPGMRVLCRDAEWLVSAAQF